MRRPTNHALIRAAAALVGLVTAYFTLAFWPVLTYEPPVGCSLGLVKNDGSCPTPAEPEPNWLVWQNRPGVQTHIPGPEGQRPNICHYSWWTGEKTCTFDTSKETGDEPIGAGYEYHGDQLWDCTTTKNHPEVRTCGLNHTYELYKNMPIPGE